MYRKTNYVVMTCGWIGIIAVGLGIWIGTLWMEARQYNRITGGNATTLDAMFIQLRVQGSEPDDS